MRIGTRGVGVFDAANPFPRRLVVTDEALRRQRFSVGSRRRSDRQQADKYQTTAHKDLPRRRRLRRSKEYARLSRTRVVWKQKFAVRSRPPRLPVCQIPRHRIPIRRDRDVRLNLNQKTPLFTGNRVGSGLRILQELAPRMPHTSVFYVRAIRGEIMTFALDVRSRVPTNRPVTCN